MAVAPLNKFLTFSVPIVPGEQTIYSAPVGVSAIVLRAQVANVAKGETYPTITVTHRRKTNKTGNIRDIRIVKNTEIPPEDALIVIDGRFVLERTALITDSLVISGSQTGIVSIFNCEYDEPTGITTIVTWDYHNFSVGDEITMSGLKFTCGNSTGITTDIFPSPQQSFTVVSVEGNPGTSYTFTTNAGTAVGIAHTYVSGGVVGPLQMEFTCSILENSNT
jgi:hypothetical protein